MIYSPFLFLEDYLLPKTFEKKPFFFFLPFSDSFFPFFFFFFFTSSIFAKFISEALAVGTAPKNIIKESIPIPGLLIFLILFFGIVKNNNFSYFVRLNTMQAILLSLILIIYANIKIIFLKIIGNILFLEKVDEILFVSTLTIFIFTSIQCIRGIEPDIPIISQAAKMQI